MNIDWYNKRIQKKMCRKLNKCWNNQNGRRLRKFILVGCLVCTKCHGGNELALCAGVTVAGLRGVQVDIPPAVRRGDQALLRCLYDLEGDALYSVKWYIGRREFYRFTPKERPQLKVFPIQGLTDLVVQVCLH